MYSLKTKTVTNSTTNNSCNLPIGKLKKMAPINSQTPYEDKYKLNKDTLLKNKARLEHHSQLVEDAPRHYDAIGPPQHAWDLLNPEAEQQREDDIRAIKEY